MSPHPGLRIIGSFGLKLSPNGFAISLTHSNHRGINAQSARSSKRNEGSGNATLAGNLSARASRLLALHNAASLFTRSRYWHDEFAVFLRYEVFGAAGGAAVCVLFLNLDHEFFRRFEIQANFAGWSVHRGRRFFNVVRRETNKLNACNFLSGFPRLHHLVKLEGG